MENGNEMNPSQNPETGAAEAKKPEEPKPRDVILIRMWPKTPFLYPLAILALVFSLIGSCAGSSPHFANIKEHYTARAPVPAAEQGAAAAESAEGDAAESAEGDAAETEEQAAAATADFNLGEEARAMVDGFAVDRIMGIIFMIIFAFTMFTLCIDVEIRWGLVAFSGAIIVVLVLLLINQQYEFLPDMLARLASLTPMANPQFYAFIFVVWAILMVISFGVVRFNYVKIESNEVIVVGGLLQRQQRYPTTRMQYIKDIHDILEYYLPLVNSGRLVLNFPEQGESVVIDNVLNIDKVIDDLDKMSGVMQVKL